MNCLKPGWITLPAFSKKYDLTRWQSIKLVPMLDKEFKEKIGTAWVILEKEALKKLKEE